MTKISFANKMNLLINSFNLALTNELASLALHIHLMTVTEHINQAKDTLISFEILPPLKGKGIQAIYDHLDPLMEFKPAYINVTYHRSEHIFKKRADGSF